MDDNTATINADQPKVEQPVSDPFAGYGDYWGVRETFRFMLPDGRQYFEIRPLDEGGKTAFQQKTSKGIRMSQGSDEATIDIDPATERHELINRSVVGWHLVGRNKFGELQFIECSDNETNRRTALQRFIKNMEPKIVQELEFFIRTKNPWMQEDVPIEELEKELARVQGLIDQKLAEEAGEADSANK